MCNNEVRSLNYDIQENDNVQLLDTTTKDGHRIYVRGIIYIMAKALNKLYPKALLSINYHLSNSMFCQIDNMDVTEEICSKTKRKNARNNRQRLGNKKSNNDKRKGRRVLCT